MIDRISIVISAPVLIQTVCDHWLLVVFGSFAKITHHLSLRSISSIMAMLGLRGILIQSLIFPTSTDNTYLLVS